MSNFEYTPDLRDFIEANMDADVNRLRLKFHAFDKKLDYDFAIIQIECRKKCKKKLASFIMGPSFLFPSTLAAEQSSHEAVAKFHASLFSSHERVADLTAGLGIDAMTIARQAKSVTACEINKLKADILIYNCNVFGIENLKVENCDSCEFIKKNAKEYDTIFIDPARRGEGNSRVYNFHDCQPDILEMKDLMLSQGCRILIKASPLLDIRQTLIDIAETSALRCICVGGECKEVLIEALQGNDSILFEAIDMADSGDILSRFSYTLENNYPNGIRKNEYNIKFATHEDLATCRYLYEPNAAIMKLAPWEEISKIFPGALKLGASSHLFISPDKIPGFPGRILKIEKLIDKKGRKSLKGFPANIVSRNYPLQAEALRKKLSVAEGKDNFIYGTRIGEKPILILATRL